MTICTMTKVVPLLLATCCLLPSGPVFAIQEAAAPPVDTKAAAEQQDAEVADKEAYNVLLEKLTAEGNANSELFKKLKPQKEKLRQEYAAAISELVDLAKKIAKDPQNRRLKADYEEKLSATIVNVNRQLKEWTDQAPTMNQALDRYSKAITETKDYRDVRLTKATEESAMWGKSNSDIEDSLRAIAEKHRKEIGDGKPLPKDVEEDVRTLNIELDYAKFRYGLAQTEQKTIAQSIRTLDNHSNAVAETRKRLSQEMQRATNAQAALAAVAERHLSRIHSAQLEQLLREFQNLTPRDGQQLDFDELFKDILLPEPGPSPAEPETSPSDSVAQDDVREILNRYLPNPEKSEP